MSTPEFLRSLGLDFASNSAVNAIIMTTLISMVAAWSNFIWSIFKTLIDRLTKFIGAFIQAKILSRLTGKTICTIEINQQNPLYLILERALLEQPPGHEMKTGYFQMIMAMATSAENSWMEQYANFLDRRRRYDISIDYSGEKSFRFASSALSKHVKRYYYTHQGYGIKIMLLKAEKSIGSDDDKLTPSSSIDIELIDYSERAITMEECPDILSSFFQKQFAITNKLPYVYTIRFGTEFMSYIEKYASKWSNSNIGLLQHSDPFLGLTDNSPYKIEKNHLPSEFHLSSRHQNLNSVTEDSYVINEISMKSNHGFIALYRQYIGELPHDYSAMSYMFKHGKIYLFLRVSSTWTLHIVTFGSVLTRPELNQTINEIIHAQSNVSESPTKDAVSIFNLTSGIWTRYILEKRSLETVYLPEKTRADIMSEITNFRQTEPFYRECGVPYRKGILL